LRKIILFAILLLPALASAQNYNFNIAGLRFSSGAAVPGACSPDGQWFFKNTTTTGWYQCVAGSYAAVGGGGGGVASVTGTANQIDVATGTTTPVLSLDPAIILPGTIQIPTQAATTPGIKFGSSTAGIGNHTSNGLDLAGSVINFYGAGGTTNTAEFVPGSGSAPFFSSLASNAQFGIDGTLSTSTTVAGVELSATGGGNINATSGTQVAVAVSGDGNGPDAFAPTSGTAKFIDLFVNPKINQTGGANGTIRVMGAYPLNTALVGTEYLLALGTASAQGNAATLTDKFTVDNSGNVVAQGSLSSLSQKNSSPCLASGTAANPSVVTCGASASGIIYCDVAASAGTCTVNTTAVTTDSIIGIFPNIADGDPVLSGKTCNTAPTVIPTQWLNAKSNATSFTIKMPTETVNGECFEYVIYSN